MDSTKKKNIKCYTLLYNGKKRIVVHGFVALYDKNHRPINGILGRLLSKKPYQAKRIRRWMVSYQKAEFYQVLIKHLKNSRMDIVDNAMTELNTLMQLASNAKLSNKKESLNENAICIDNKQYLLSETCWNRIFKHLIVDPSAKSRSYSDMSYKRSFEKLLNNFVDRFFKGDFSPSFMVQCYPITLIKPVDQTYYELVFSLLKYGMLEDSQGNIKYFVDKLRSTLNSNISSCYKEFNKEELSDVDTRGSSVSQQDLAYGIRIPYSKLISWLGAMLFSNIFVIHNRSYFLDVKTNPNIYEWIKEPNLSDPIKLLSPSLPLGVLGELGLSGKGIKLIITYLCVEFYKEYDLNTKLGLDVFNILREYIGPHLNKMEQYLTHSILKVGGTLVSLLTYAGIFAGSLLVSKLSGQVQAFKRVRVVVVKHEFSGLFLKGENLCRPYLVASNKRTNSYDKNSTEYFYWKQVNNKVHSNQSSSCKIKDLYKDILFQDQKFLIDQDALLRLIEIISLASDLNIENYYESKFIKLFSLYDITQNTLRFLQNNDTEVIISKILSFLIDFNEEPEVTSTHLIKVLRKSFCHGKSSLLELIHKVIGIKYSLKMLIYDAVVYSHFRYFIQPTYLDTRGRKYILNASLNIQAGTFIRAIVKLPGLPIGDSINDQELQTIRNIIKNYVNNLTLVNFNLIREGWKNKYGFTKGNNTILKLISSEVQCRLDLLCTFFKDSLKILDSLKKNKFELNENLVEIIYNGLNKKKTLFQVLDIIASLDFYKYPHKLRSRPYPVEHDATASGIQMSAYLLRSTSLARWSNLIPNSEHYDLYTTAANMFSEAVDVLMNIALPDVSQELPENLLWLINKSKPKETNREIFIRFNETLITLKHIIKKYPKLKDLYSKRDPWKKSIMTYGYNSSTRGRSDANSMYIKNNLSEALDKKELVFLGVILENYFKNVIQPELIGDTTKIKAISSLLASTLKLNKDSITFNNKFLIHKIKPAQYSEQRFSTNSYKKGIRGYRVNYSMPIYDKSGKLCLNIRKARQVIGPNLAHFCDAGVVHEQALHLNKINELIRQTKINYELSVTTIHDCYIFPDNLFGRASIALAYHTYFHDDPIYVLKNNLLFDEILNLRNTQSDANSQFEIIELNDKFIK